MSSSALVGHAASLLRRGVIGGTSCYSRVARRPSSSCSGRARRASGICARDWSTAALVDAALVQVGVRPHGILALLFDIAVRAAGLDRQVRTDRRAAFADQAIAV